MRKRQRNKKPSAYGHSKSNRSSPPDPPVKSKVGKQSIQATKRTVVNKEFTSNKPTKKAVDFLELKNGVPATTGVAKKRKSFSPKTINGSATAKEPSGVESAELQSTKRSKKYDALESNGEAEDNTAHFVEEESEPAFEGAYGGEDMEEDDSETYDEEESDTQEDEYGSDEEEGQELNIQDKNTFKSGAIRARNFLPIAPKRLSSLNTNLAGWTVEENDQDLRYESEVEGNDVSRDDLPKLGGKKMEPFARKSCVIKPSGKNGDVLASANYTDDEDDTSYESDEEYGSDWDMWGSSSEEGIFPRSNWDSFYEHDNDWNDSYDSDTDDQDITPSGTESDEDRIGDVHIPYGEAEIYDLDDDSVEFVYGVSQIIELLNDGVIYGKRVADAPSDAGAESDASCPPLVPIYDDRGEFIDSMELLKEYTPNAFQKVQEAEPSETMKSDDTLGLEGEEKLGASIEIVESIADEMKQEVSTEEDNQPSFHKFYDAIDRRMSLGVLRQQIYFYGHVSVQALFGKVEIMGYSLDTAEARTVSAVRGYNAVDLCPQPSPEAFNKAAFEQILLKLKPHFIDADIHKLIETFDPADSVLVLLEADTTNCPSLPVICNYLEEYVLFPTTNTLTGKSPFRRTEHLLEVELFAPGLIPTRPIPLFQKNPAWDELQLKPSTRLVVVGGKGAGKSTLCQFLVNRFIRQFGRILLIDLDIGQPLLHLPETISASMLLDPLLGVGCFGKVQPLRCLLFGSLNVVSSPLVYIQNVRTLVQHCEADPDLKNVPWIVNTMGYVSGFGEELTAAIVRLVRPTDLLQLTIPKTVKGAQNYQQMLTEQHVNGFKFNILHQEVGQLQHQLHYQCHPLDVIFEQKGCPMHPPKRRTLSIITQLVRILNDTTEWFTDMKPFCAPLDDLQILITRDEYSPSKEMLPGILNAAMVYLCERLEHGQYNCLGVGIVRAVDDNNNVHLLHYLPPEQLAKAKVLALCNTSLPSQIYLRLNTKMDGTIPYLQNVG